MHILISVFDGGLFQALGANSAEERDSWLQALQLASYECMRSQLLALQQRIEAFRGINTIPISICYAYNVQFQQV